MIMMLHVITVILSEIYSPMHSAHGSCLCYGTSTTSASMAELQQWHFDASLSNKVTSSASHFNDSESHNRSHNETVRLDMEVMPTYT